MMMMMRRRLGCCTRDTQISLDFDEQERVTRYEGLENCILNSEAYDGDDESASSEWSHNTDVDMDMDADAGWMKDTFAKLLLGGDASGGGSNGLSSACAVSKAITSLGGAVFGELWTLEPLPRERLSKWRTQLRWLLSPAAYMVELVPAKHRAADFQIMTPRPRADVHMLLPALCKLDEMLIHALDQAPAGGFGLSDSGRRQLASQSRVVGQLFKAAKSINQTVLLEMPVPALISDALPRSAKASLGEELYRALAAEDVALDSESPHGALDLINKLEAALLSRPASSEAVVVERAAALVARLKARHPNLPPSFLDATKVQYGNDVGHSILEAYSRVLANLAFTILTRMEDVARQDATSSSSSSTTWCSDSTCSTSSSARDFELNSYTSRTLN